MLQANFGKNSFLAHCGQITVKKWQFLPEILFLKVFDFQLQFLSLDLAENFLKSTPKCLLACVSGTHGKIQNWGFFAQKVSKRAIFTKNSFLEVFD